MKPNVWTGMVAGMLLGGLCVLAVSKPFTKTLAQESTSAAQSSVIMGQSASDQDIDLMRQDLRNKKRQIIAENLPLSDIEAEKFWPIYIHYTNDLKQSEGPGVTFQVCTRSEPGLDRKGDGHIFSVGPSHQHDDGCATVFANPIGTRQKEVETSRFY